jgi:hypothetical protein
MKTDICSVCGSSKIMHDLSIVDKGHGNTKYDLSVQIKTTDRTFFNTFEEGVLKAQICGSCGKVDLAISNPQALWEAHLKSKNL